MIQNSYQGKELPLFEKAINWKNYLATFFSPLLKGRVLEVGAGLGATTQLLNNGIPSYWLALEPDDYLYSALEQKVRNNIFPANTVVQKGCLNDIEKTEKFDVILYIDVLEHIENDKEEFRKAINLLDRKGYIIVLCPAFQCLFTSFDKAIGHYRRYNKKDYRSLTFDMLQPVLISYLDSTGFLASLANKLILKQSYPTKKQVMYWDRCLIPVSIIFDKLLFYSFGKSILGIWQKK